MEKNRFYGLPTLPYGYDCKNDRAGRVDAFRNIVSRDEFARRFDAMKG